MNISGRLVALGSAAAATIVGGSLAVVYTADAATDTLLSAGRPAVASTVGGDRTPAGNAVDGRPGTRWVSGPGVAPQWLRVDLGAPVQVTRVRLSWDRSFARAYQLQVSTDAAAWTDLLVTSTGDGGTDNVTGLIFQAFINHEPVRTALYRCIKARSRSAFSRMGAGHIFHQGLDT